MTAREFISSMTSIAPHLSSEQMVLACRFVAAMATNGNASQLANERRARRSMELDWEERELARVGNDADLRRQRREPR